MAMALQALTEVSKINSYLFVCGSVAVTKDNIEHFGITHVINLTKDVPCLSGCRVETMRIFVDDNPNENLSVYFNKCADHINHVRQCGGKILVHCVAGVSRSVSICLAYLMRYRSLNLAQAFLQIQRSRFFINPNYGFWNQLIAYEKQLRGVASVRMIMTERGPEPDIYQTKPQIPYFVKPVGGAL